MLISAQGPGSLLFHLLGILHLVTMLHLNLCFMTPWEEYIEEYWKENIATLGTTHIHSQACWCLDMGSRSTLPTSSNKTYEVSYGSQLSSSCVEKCKEEIWPNEWLAMACHRRTAEKLCLTFPGGLKVASGSSIQTFPFFIAIPGSTNLSNWKHWYHLEKWWNMMKHVTK